MKVILFFIFYLCFLTSVFGSSESCSKTSTFLPSSSKLVLPKNSSVKIIRNSYPDSCEVIINLGSENGYTPKIKFYSDGRVALQFLSNYSLLSNDMSHRISNSTSMDNITQTYVFLPKVHDEIYYYLEGDKLKVRMLNGSIVTIDVESGKVEDIEGVKIKQGLSAKEFLDENYDSNISKESKFSRQKYGGDVEHDIISNIGWDNYNVKGSQVPIYDKCIKSQVENPSSRVTEQTKIFCKKFAVTTDLKNRSLSSPVSLGDLINNNENIMEYGFTIENVEKE